MYRFQIFTSSNFFPSLVAFFFLFGGFKPGTVNLPLNPLPGLVSMTSPILTARSMNFLILES